MLQAMSSKLSALFARISGITSSSISISVNAAISTRHAVAGYSRETVGAAVIRWGAKTYVLTPLTLKKDECKYKLFTNTQY